MGKIKSWRNKKILISQEDYDKLEEDEKEGKYSSEKIKRSHFTLFELLLAPKSNPLLAVEELHFAKQGSMDSGEFHAHVVKIAKRCKFPWVKAEERAIRDTIFLGMNSTWARDKAINLMNEEGKELTVEFLMQQLEVEDCNAHHKSLSELDSTTSVNFAAYDHRQNKSKSNKKNWGNLPHMFCGWSNSKTSRNDSFHHSRLQERLLNDSTSSRLQETHLYGPTIWQIPVDMTTNGNSGCTRHFPIQAGFNLYWHGRCHRNC